MKKYQRTEHYHFSNIYDIEECHKHCKNCGHSVFIPFYRKKKICSHCGMFVFFNSDMEDDYKRNLFKKKLLKELRWIENEASCYTR